MNFSKAKEDWTIVKIDIRKAFDIILWNFIDKILNLLDLRVKFRNLILSCLKNVKYTPLINGKKTNPFYPSRGIRQGDLLSP